MPQPYTKHITTPVTIEKDIPLPPPYNERGPHYPWDKMEVGDSFIFQCNPEDKQKISVTLSTDARSYTYRNQKQMRGRTFTTRQVDCGVRIWRTK